MTYAQGDELIPNKTFLICSPGGTGAVAGHSAGVGDIMAQQLKFIACLKIMMEELATLATGFEVDGGQLRFQLYIWLEREVEVLKKICKYGLDIVSDTAKSKFLKVCGAVLYVSISFIHIPFRGNSISNIILTMKRC